jgi:hypothetical protein
MKYIATIIFIIIAVQSFGQFTKGDKVLGGEFSLSAQRAPESPNGGLVNKATSFSIAPNFGAFLNKSWEIGMEVGYSSTDYERNTTIPIISNWESRGIAVGLYTQKYIVITENFLFSITGRIRYNFDKTFDKTTNTITNEVTESEGKDRRIGLSLRPRFIFFPSNNWAFQASIGYISCLYSFNDDQPLTLFNLNYGTINLGLSYYIRQKTKE